ncbi:MAG: DUF1552 domain-containing protein [Gammaproteobacteria bacterium]|nr:DUF1552 domain-containing protein [Gammaproteobacteria bacterium]MDH5344405.1 DUF1552 domain-containing protein [Gammaproteobacteria bacterium]
MPKLSRRRILKGMLGGSAVTVGLPFLDCFLNENGTALASGLEMPVRFGTWGYGLGGTTSVFVPKTLGADYDLPPEIESWARVREHINLFTNSKGYLDGNSNRCHYSGWVIARCGIAPSDRIPGETIDTTMAKQIGKTTRYNSLTATATGNVTTTYSYVNADTPNPAEWSPIKFYTRLFGPDFQDPNASAFKPDPRIMVRKSVLSGIMEQTRALEKTVGAADRARIDQYFTELRQLERRFEHRLSKPEPIAGCQPHDQPPEELAMGSDVESVQMRHRMMTDLMVMALACDQTRIFNMAFSDASSGLIKPGYEKPHHTCTHEEPVDEDLGYQPNASWFTRRSMEAWADFVEAFTKVREGDGTLLDNVLIYATTDVGYARTHTLDEMVVFTAGRAGGKVRSGLHIDLQKKSPTVIGYTALQVMGADLPSWGALNNESSEVLHEILV